MTKAWRCGADRGAHNSHDLRPTFAAALGGGGEGAEVDALGGASGALPATAEAGPAAGAGAEAEDAAAAAAAAAAGGAPGLTGPPARSSATNSFTFASSTWHRGHEA